MVITAVLLFINVAYNCWSWISSIQMNKGETGTLKIYSESKSALRAIREERFEPRGIKSRMTEEPGSAKRIYCVQIQLKGKSIRSAEKLLREKGIKSELKESGGKNATVVIGEKTERRADAESLCRRVEETGIAAEVKECPAKVIHCLVVEDMPYDKAVEMSKYEKDVKIEWSKPKMRH